MYALLVWMMYYCMLDDLDLLFYGQMPTGRGQVCTNVWIFSPQNTMYIRPALPLSTPLLLPTFSDGVVTAVNVDLSCFGPMMAANWAACLQGVL